MYFKRETKNLIKHYISIEIPDFHYHVKKNLFDGKEYEYDEIDSYKGNRMVALLGNTLSKGYLNKRYEKLHRKYYHHIIEKEKEELNKFKKKNDDRMIEFYEYWIEKGTKYINGEISFTELGGNSSYGREAEVFEHTSKKFLLIESMIFNSKHWDKKRNSAFVYIIYDITNITRKELEKIIKEAEKPGGNLNTIIKTDEYHEFTPTSNNIK